MKLLKIQARRSFGEAHVFRGRKFIPCGPPESGFAVFKLVHIAD
jgi:hypothetical protein